MNLTLNGIKRTAQEWSDILGIPVPTIQRRKERGAEDEEALRPVDPKASERMRQLGRDGGRARAESLTPERRREIAKQASAKLNGPPMLIKAFGREGSTSDWESWCGIPRDVLFERKMAEWSDEDAVSIPVGSRR